MGEPARPRFPWITVWLSMAMVGVQLAFAPGPEPRSLLEAGAKSVALVADAGQSWRLFTSHFVHTSWIHLGFNLAFLFPVAGALEAVCRRRDYLMLLSVVASGAGVATLAFTPEVSAGASGLVFGILAAAVVFGLRHGQRLAPNLRMHFGLWVLPFLGIVLLAGAGNRQLDHFSHLGGLLSGLAGATLMRLRSDRASILLDGPRMGLLLAAPAIVLLCGPTIARHGHAHATTEVHELRLEVPPGWRPEYGPLGEFRFRRPTAFATLGIDRVPRARDPWSWYRDHRIVPIADVGTVRREAAAGRVRYRFEVQGRPQVRELRIIEHRNGRFVTSFTSPQAWFADYAETRDRALGSIRPASAPK